MNYFFQVKLMENEDEKTIVEKEIPESLNKTKQDTAYDWGEFFHEYREPIGQLIKAFGKRYLEEPTQQFRSTALALFIVVCVIASIVYLGSIRVLTDNTISFVFGAIIGYVFSFLSDFLPAKE